MANFEGLSTMRNMMMYNGKSPLLPPKSPFPSIAPPYVDYLPSSQKDTSKSRGGSHHQRTSSESCIIEEQPSWLDDLLNEPEITPVQRGGGHRRSSSDSFTNFHTANLINSDYGHAQDDYYKDAIHPTLHADRNSSNRQKSRARNSSPNAVPRQQDSVESVAPDPSKNSLSENDTKRAKQQFAQRSRVRKLQYISELERNVQHLQAEGSEVSAELEFLNQQNLILGMENKALKQRLENLAQEQLIKYLEHEVLERERGRLRALYKQQQLPQSQQQQLSSSSHRRTSSRDLDQQFSDLSLKHKEGSGQLQM